VFVVDLHGLRCTGGAVAAAIPFRFPQHVAGARIMASDRGFVDDHDLPHAAVSGQARRTVTDLAITPFPNNRAVRAVLRDERNFWASRRTSAGDDDQIVDD